MRILAIDPGTTQSAWCLLDDDGSPIRFGIAKNESLVAMLPGFIGEADKLAIEMVASYGQPVGQEVFRTCWWSGRFAEAWQQAHEASVLPIEIFRKEVAMHLCQTARIKDGMIRQRLIDIFGGDGGRKEAMGTKKAPGPLYGVSKDVWSALAIGITAQARIQRQG